MTRKSKQFVIIFSVFTILSILLGLLNFVLNLVGLWYAWNLSGVFYMFSLLPLIQNSLISNIFPSTLLDVM